MLQTFINILPLALATGISIALFMFMMMILMRKDRQTANSFMFIIGVFATLILVGGLMVIFIKPAVHDLHQPKSLVHGVIDLVLAVACLLLVAHKILSKKAGIAEEKAGKKEIMVSWGPVHFLAAGFGLRLLSLDTMPPFIGAMRYISMAGIASGEKFLLLVITSIIATLPLLIPWIMFVINPERAISMLVPFKTFIDRRKKVIVCVILILLAALFIHTGTTAIIAHVKTAAITTP